MPSSLYVHVPFCEQICHYCDFNKFFLKNQPVEEYVDLAIQEMQMTVEKYPQKHAIRTIYVGGGTPTSLDTPTLEKLLKGIKSTFTLHDEVEWTVEVNPGSADQEKLNMLKAVGVNRLSIGAQTFDPMLLQTINRDHKPTDVGETVQMSIQAGITNLSVDLMFGLPNQTMEQWKDTLSKLVELPVAHVSAYSLKVEPKTVFYQLWQKGRLPLLPQELEADMYDYLKEFLGKNHFSQYEISNFAKTGKESIHNLTYWDNNEYYGIGAGAHSYVYGIRRMNHGPLPKYMKALKASELPYLDEHPVSQVERMEEQMFMGLRKRKGISVTEFKKRFNKDVEDVFPTVVSSLREKGLLDLDGDYLLLTEKGMLLGNEVFEQFLLTEED
ncbi:oxygen-independent coproporphyrinogen III oxidase [Paenalkalicoccus suaedae]|uniref:Heme chaperone HemW n=1 Tax=Paenalkalicoccus suaedae TaxID=2592382 RepID=A0A859FK72_9BACI|nr:radical SAM family heme chaperone HemW [Paenalkalicoccus suaedae]QKS73205.1 oxygen-independent coproporphyrinogen III oxidase [Paenalkalicoccus suaedae]